MPPPAASLPVLTLGTATPGAPPSRMPHLPPPSTLEPALELWTRLVTRSRLAPLALLAALPLVSGCASSSGAGSDEEGVPIEAALDGPEPWDAEQSRDNRKIGFVLTELDRKLRTWNELVLTGSTDRDGHIVKRIEDSLAYETMKYLDPLLEQLVVGPPNNRRIAAAALGFSGAPRALGPLLAALTDPDVEVIGNALLSLGTLRAADTPLASIAALLSEHPEAQVRSNASRALRSLVDGSRAEDELALTRDAARRALGDTEIAVRVNACLLLAQLEDVESIDRITLALGDKETIVARAASRSIARLGSIEVTSKGRAARALAAALLRVDRDRVRPAILRDLQALAGKNFGDESDPWLEWANRLP